MKIAGYDGDPEMDRARNLENREGGGVHFTVTEGVRRHPPTQTTEDWLASHAPHGKPCVQNGPRHPDLHLVWIICDCGHRHGTTNDKLPLEMRLADLTIAEEMNQEDEGRLLAGGEAE